MEVEQDPPKHKYERFDANDETVQLVCQGLQAISSFIEEDPTKVNEIQLNGYTLLQIAAYKGSKDIVKFLLDQGADIHIKAYNDETALHLACDMGHEDIVKMLLKRHWQITQKDENWGNNALHFAARGGNEKIVKFLLHQGVDINITNKCGNSALNLAADGGHEKIINLLFDKKGIFSELHLLFGAIAGKHKRIVEFAFDSGINLCVRNHCEGLLRKACESGHEDIVKLLVERELNIDVEDSYFYQLLSSNANNRNVFKLLVDYGIDVYIPKDKRTTISQLVSETDKKEIKRLVYCSSKNLLSGPDKENETIVKLLIDSEIDVVPTELFNHCLRLACKYGYEDIVKKRFDRVSKSKLKNKLDKSILLDAAKGGNVNIVQLLLDQEIPVDTSNYSKETALHVACEAGHIDIVELLLKYGADISAGDEYGNSTLHFAARGGNKDIFELILRRHGIDVNVKNYFYKYVLHIACQRGHEEIVKILLQSDNLVDSESKNWSKCRGNTALHYAVKGGSRNIVKQLLDRGIEVDAINDNKESALHVACETGSEDIVKILIEYGANINVGGESKENPVLHHAVLSENENLVKLLLNYGVDVHSKDADGVTPLLLAVKRGNLEIIELLIKYGAKISDKDNRGFSVYHMVAKYIRSKNQAYDAYYEKREYLGPISVSSVLKINKIVGLFFNLGLDINCIDNEGDTPLHALNRDLYNLEMVKLFLNYGANIFAKNNKGETALKLACGLGLVSTAKLLLDLGADVEAKDSRGVTILASLAENGFPDVKVVRLLLHYGANVNVCGGNLRKPALSSAIGCSNELIELLLDYGASVDEAKDGRFHALSLAVGRGCRCEIELLFDYGAELDVENENFKRMIEVLITNCEEESIDVDCADCVTQHVVKLKAANEHVPEKILKDIEGNEVQRKHKVQCEREIEKMKSDDSEVPYWRILTSNQRCLANIARNDETVRFFASCNYDRKYRIYSSALKNQMRIGTWRKMLLDKVNNFFKAIAEAKGNERLPKLPDLCVDQIFSYLSNRDFRNLIRVCDPYNDFGLDLCDVSMRY